MSRTQSRLDAKTGALMLGAGILGAVAGFALSKRRRDHQADLTAHSYTLKYFPMPGAPGELCRVMLTLGKFKWADERIPGSKWGKLKATSRWGQMPILCISDGRELAQAKAIARFLGKQTIVDGATLYPTHDPWRAAQVDELLNLIEDDIRCLIVATFQIKDQAEKEAARAGLFSPDGGKMFARFQRLEDKLDPDTRYLLGDSLTIADVHLFITVNSFESGFLDGLPAHGWLEHLPKLVAVIANVAAVPAIKAYYETQADKMSVYKVFVGKE